MCGINGIIFKRNEPDISKILGMNKLLNHRGPDALGYKKFEKLLLGHTRLSILDLSTKGHQPMTVDGRYWIIYNGEIYNFEELKSDLLNKNYKFFSNSDTEVVLNSYREWGVKCFEKFNGEWALAIYDNQNNELLICRDGIGYKPCYIYEDENYISFSSELKTFYCLNEKIEFDPDNIGIASSTLYGTSKTIFKNINHLPQGRYYLINTNTFKQRIERWDYPLKKIPKIHVNYRQNVDEYFDLMYQAVKIRLNNDVKTGTSLSGGLDSSSVFALLNLINEREGSLKNDLDLNPIILDYPEMKTKYEAIELVNNLKRKYSLLDFNENNLFDVKELVTSFEIIEEFQMQRNLYKFQSDKGIKVSIDGHGADEFLGYPNWIPELSVDLFNNLVNFYKTILKFGNTHNINRFKSLFGLGDLVPKNIDFVSVPQTENIYKDYIKSNEFHASNQIINDDLDELSNFTYQMNFTYLMSYCGWFQFFLNKWDKASMINSVEIRMPFLDNNVRLFSLALSSNDKFNNEFTKSILRDAFTSYLPDNLKNQKFKQGLTAKKFIPNKKEINIIHDIINQKDFKEFGLWDYKNIQLDFSKNINSSKIWNICKYYLMITGFKEKYENLDKDNLYKESYNYLKSN